MREAYDERAEQAAMDRRYEDMEAAADCDLRPAPQPVPAELEGSPLAKLAARPQRLFEEA